MSSIYIQEPSTSGKVLLQTTVGDIDIELWSKETPKACRNFIQLCLEGYYDNTIFHRVIKSFIAQGGDPNGDGTGGESAYGAPFKDEFHSRLRFVRRGLVAMANAGPNDNGSQFFFTLGSCPELYNKHTIFGKVTGDTLYNMLKLEDCLVDNNDRPVYPHKVVCTKVLLNPFADIMPRLMDDPVATVEYVQKEKIKKNFSLLSFGAEAEEEEIETDSLAQKFRGKSKSSHDLANDPHLSSVSAVSLYKEIPGEKMEILENVRKKLKSDHLKEAKQTTSDTEKSNQFDNISKQKSEREQIQMQIKQLTQELKKKNSQKEEREIDSSFAENISEKDDESNPLLQEYHEQRKLYREKSSIIPQDKSARDKMTMQLLSNFKSKLMEAQNVENESLGASGERTKETQEEFGWLQHRLKFNEANVAPAKDANVPLDDRYDITDPRNPMAKRRRAGREKMHTK